MTAAILAASVRSEILEDISAERDRQDGLWGAVGVGCDGRSWLQDVLGHHVMLAIVTEELGEVARHLNDERISRARAGGESGLAHLRKELIQTAASCVKWIEWFTVSSP